MALTAGLLASAAGAAGTTDAPPAMPGLATPPPIKDDGTITVPSFDLPFSSFASPEATQALVQRIRNPMPISADVAKMRQSLDEKLIKPQLEKAKAAYLSTSTKSVMGGVPVETFLPAAGIAPANKDRVLSTGKTEIPDGPIAIPFSLQGGVEGLPGDALSHRNTGTRDERRYTGSSSTPRTGCKI